MTEPVPVRALSFDVDGTLYPVKKFRVAWRLRWERGLLLAMLAAREKLRHSDPEADGEALIEREAELVAPSFNLSVPEARRRLLDLRAALPEALTRGVGPFRGVRSALEGAHAKGLKLAVLSDYDPHEKLRWLGLQDLPWSAKMSAESTGALKPHARSFTQLANALDVPAASIVHIGDREDLDVVGAHAAGMRAWRFCRKGSTRTDAEHTFNRWSVGLFVPLTESGA